jgi:hypothetical protein
MSDQSTPAPAVQNPRGGHTSNGAQPLTTIPVGIAGGTLISTGSGGSNWNVPSSQYISFGSTLIPATPPMAIPPVAWPRSTLPELPPFTLDSEDENGLYVQLTLCPESNISAQEALKLMLLLTSYNESRNKFSVFGYVKANNLEKHFRFST